MNCAHPYPMAFYDEGVYDPLTGLLAPVFFYESAQRLSSWAQRTNRPTTLISIKLGELSDDELLKTATVISNELRGGDLLARMSEKIFVLYLLGDKLGAEQLIFRLRNKCEAELVIAAIEVEPEAGLIPAMKHLGI